MSQTKLVGIPKLKIVNKNPGTVSTGSNTLAYLDGVLLRTASFIKIEFNSRKATKVLIEMFVDPEIEIDTDIRLVSKMDLKGKQLIVGTFKSVDPEKE